MRAEMGCYLWVTPRGDRFCGARWDEVRLGRIEDVVGERHDVEPLDFALEGNGFAMAGLWFGHAEWKAD